MLELLTVVISTYNQLDHELPLILHSLALQLDKRFNVQVWHDGDVDFLYGDTKDYWKYFNVEREGTKERTNDFGYSQRNRALAAATTKYICFAAADQYYIPHFTYYFLKKMEEENLDFAWCNFIHQYGNSDGKNNLPYSLFDSTMNRCRIDISNFMVKTELAKQIMFDLSDPRFADGNFVEAFKVKFPEARCGKLEQILVCHN